MDKKLSVEDYFCPTEYAPLRTFFYHVIKEHLRKGEEPPSEILFKNEFCHIPIPVLKTAEVDFSTASRDICHQYVWDCAQRGKDPNPFITLAMYGNKNNWEQIHANQRCYWAWAGPTICGYELAQTSVQRHQKKFDLPGLEEPFNIKYGIAVENPSAKVKAKVNDPKEVLPKFEVSNDGHGNRKIKVVEDFTMTHVSLNRDGSVGVGGVVPNVVKSCEKFEDVLQTNNDTPIAGGVDNSSSEKNVSSEEKPLIAIQISGGNLPKEDIKAIQDFFNSNNRVDVRKVDGNVIITGSVKDGVITTGFDLDQIEEGKILEHQKLSKKRYWCSWYHPEHEDFGFVVPPFQYWVSGQCDLPEHLHTENCQEDFTICAVIDAYSEDEIIMQVENYFPGCRWRFRELSEDDYSPLPCRFPGFEGHTSLYFDEKETNVGKQEQE